MKKKEKIFKKRVDKMTLLYYNNNINSYGIEREVKKMTEEQNKIYDEYCEKLKDLQGDDLIEAINLIIKKER